MSNVADALVSLGVLSEAWPFVSGNLALIEQTVAVYGLGGGGAGLLFASVVAWQFVATVFFWRAAVDPGAGSAGHSDRVLSAFAVSLAFWGALLVADEVFVVYRHADVTLVHWGLATAQVVSLLAVRRLGDA